MEFFSPSSKNKKIHDGKMELSNSNIEKNWYTSRNEKPNKTPYIFSKESCSNIFGNRSPPKQSLYFRKRNFFIIQETEALSSFSSSKNKEDPFLFFLRNGTFFTQS